MGIVVSIIMLYGIIILWKRQPLFGVRAKIASAMMFCGGLWNSVWYGVQHSHHFWGVAAIVSGVLMLLSAFLVLMRSASQERFTRLRLVVVIGMLLCFILYLVTIVRLNLGLPIIRWIF